MSDDNERNNDARDMKVISLESWRSGLSNNVFKSKSYYVGCPSIIKKDENVRVSVPI